MLQHSKHGLEEMTALGMGRAKVGKQRKEAARRKVHEICMLHRGY